MRTPSGLIELDCGWVLAVAPLGPGLIRFVLQFDPKREVLAHGVKDLRLSVDEATELRAALDGAIVRARPDRKDL